MQSLVLTFKPYAAKALSIIVQGYTVPLLTFSFSLPLYFAGYRDWYDLGAGGVPHNAVGWIVQSVLRVLASRDLWSVESGNPDSK